jgi:predicted transcriptional regulator
MSVMLQFTVRIASDLAQSGINMLAAMTQQSELFRVQLDSRMLLFAQAVETPVNQALQASSTAAGMATELAGRYVGL